MRATAFPITVTAPAMSAWAFVVIVVVGLVIIRGPAWIAELTELYKAKTERRMLESDREVDSLPVATTPTPANRRPGRGRRRKRPPDEPT
jgi:hypothetical protein